MKKIALISFGAEQSRRLPGKNYKILCGKELCRYTFDFIKEHLPEYPYYVFTDSEVIKKIALEYDIIVIDCKKEERDGVNGTILVQDTIKADYYFKLPFTSPIRDVKNIKFNMDLCLNNKVNFAYTANFKADIMKPKPTGSLFFWKDEKTNNAEYRTVVLPDYFDFDIDYQTDFDRVEKYLKGLK
jgi:CMP-N-acetylneuraminic acid synthetase